jgi:mRNA-degrading endonuclease RelE of RelBE toxin-antitoxin system
MKIRLTAPAEKEWHKLPLSIRKKAEKQTRFLVDDMFYPSLRTKKVSGREGLWEARIDYHYRMTFQKVNDTIIIRALGPHDAGLGEK